MNFFNDEFGLNLPENYKLYERDKTKRNGTYAFKFRKSPSQGNKRPPKTKFDSYDSIEILAEVEKLVQQYKQLHDRCEDADAASLGKVMDAAVKSGLKRGVITEDQIKDVLSDQRTDIDLSKMSAEMLFYAEDDKDQL